MILTVRACLDSPVVLTDDLHLDGLLCSAHPFCRTRPIDRSSPVASLIIPPLPVATATVNGYSVALATVAIFPSEARMSSNHAVGRKDAEDIEALARPVHLGLGPGKNRMHTLPTVVTPWVTWRAVGDRRGIMRLVRRMTHLGSWRSAGYGVVRQWDVVQEDLDPMGVLIDGGCAQRHLPVAWTTWAESQTVGALVSPYWHPGRQTSEIIRAGTRCALDARVSEVVYALADPDAQRAHRERHQHRAAARRAERDARLPA